MVEYTDVYIASLYEVEIYQLLNNQLKFSSTGSKFVPSLIRTVNAIKESS